MATRRKAPVFTAPEEEEETKSIEEFLDASAREMFETISREEEEAEEEEVKVEAVVEQVTPTPPPKPMSVILPEITPTDYVGPRFVEETVAPAPKPQAPAPAPQLQPPPKRHPRNVPKFSRHK